MIIKIETEGKAFWKNGVVFEPGRFLGLAESMLRCIVVVLVAHGGPKPLILTIYIHTHTY